MKMRSRVIGWLMAAVLAVTSVFLSLALPRLVPDYKNMIRTVEYDSGIIISATDQEEGIELYPWTELREEDCTSLGEIKAYDWDTWDAMREFFYSFLYTLKIAGFLRDFSDDIQEELEQNTLYDGEAARLYGRNLSVETWDGEGTLDFVMGPAGLEYLKITLTWERELSSEESAEIQRTLRERQVAFRMGYYGYISSEEDESSWENEQMSGGMNTITDGGTVEAETDAGVPGDVFEEFYSGLYSIGDSMGWEMLGMVDEAFSSFSCDIIPYQDEFLLVYSNEDADAEMILIYDATARRINGFSFRF